MGGVICHKVADDIKRVLPDAPISVVTYSTPLKPAASFFPRVARLEKIFEKLEFDGNPSGLYPFVAMRGANDLMVDQAAAKLPENGIIHTILGADHSAQFNTPSTSLRLRAAVRLAAHMASRSVQTWH